MNDCAAALIFRSFKILEVCSLKSDESIKIIE